MTNTANTAAIHVGISPAGVEWNVYPRSGETRAQAEARAAAQRDRLDAVRAKHDARTVSVKLSEAAIWLVEDRASLYEGDEYAADAAAMVTGKTFVRASRRLLAAVADDLEVDTEDHALAAAQGADTDSQARQDFAERSARRSITTAVRRIREAI